MNESRRARPNTFLIGAPKCGTTSLVQYLDRHPQIFVCDPKEPHFFEKEIPRGVTSLGRYERLFSHARPQHKVILEASTGYLYSPTAVNGILAYCPDARFIVCIRNPFRMCLSLHQQALRGGYESEADMNAAWQLQKARKAGDQLPEACSSWRLLMYRERCALGDQLERLLSIVDRSRVHVVVLDDLRARPNDTLAHLQSFLQVDCHDLGEFPVANRAWAPRIKSITRMVMVLGRLKRRMGIYRSFGLANRINRLNARSVQSSKLDEYVQNDMALEFEDQVSKLERLLSMDLSAWKDDCGQGS